MKRLSAEGISVLLRISELESKIHQSEERELNERRRVVELQKKLASVNSRVKKVDDYNNLNFFLLQYFRRSTYTSSFFKLFFQAHVQKLCSTTPTFTPRVPRVVPTDVKQKSSKSDQVAKAAPVGSKSVKLKMVQPRVQNPSLGTDVPDQERFLTPMSG